MISTNFNINRGGQPPHKYFRTMKQNIKEAIGKLDYEAQLRIMDTIKALDNGKAHSVEFYSDGSGVCITYWSPTINHGTPGTIARSFPMNEALLPGIGCNHMNFLLVCSIVSL